MMKIVAATKKFRKRLIWFGVVTPVAVLGLLMAILFWKQDAIVQELIATVNTDFTGEVEIQDSHISPFTNFPYVSIDLENLKIYEDKTKSGVPLMNIANVYLGFDFWTLVQGKMEIKALKLSSGSIKLIQHTDGTLNIQNALTTTRPIADTNEEFHLDIQVIRLDGIDIWKLNEENNVVVEAFIEEAESQFKKATNHVFFSLDTRFLVNVIINGDSTFVKNKEFEIETQLEYTMDRQLLTIKPSAVTLEKAVFKMDGRIDVDDDMNLDINFHGTKPNFDLFMAFAPEELTPVLERYENAGNIFFDASIKGKSINGHVPLVVADFGCEDAYFNNKRSQKRVDELYFKGHFTNGENRNASTMEFSLIDFTAAPEAGTFSGNLRVKNFDSPDIEMRLRSEFDLDFLAQFLNITDLEDLKGHVALTMNFHDIIDLNNPEKSIAKLNESYFTELAVKGLSFRSPSFHLPVHSLDIKASMDGHEALIDHFRMKVGDSDISLRATISDLPAILHHTSDLTTAEMVITSSFLDIGQLTAKDTVQQKPVTEQIKDLQMKLKFTSSARAFTESPNLPIGEFFIEDLHAELSHYPHTLHDVHADVFVDNQDFRVVDFTGMIDQSDFHFTGKLNHYDLWFMDEPLGDTNIDFNFTSALLQLEDLFSYQGENFVPKEYRHEQFRDLKIHGLAALHFNKGLQSADVTIDQVEAQMKIHPLRFEKFKGRVHYADDHLIVENLSGKLGKTEFIANLNYYLGNDVAARKRDNHLSLKSPRLDFDELFKYNSPPTTTLSTPVDHEAAFNIYDLPFTDMTFDFDIKHVNYHRYLLDDFLMKARTQENHFLYIDTLSMAAAGGELQVKGYFNGTDRNKIYFSPDIRVHQIDLDKLLFKFENFGQDHLVSENLHGKLSGRLTGKIHMHADMVPNLGDSEIKLDVVVTQGRLERYAALDALSDYFKDKNLSKVLFDTLENRVEVNKGELIIPKMTINSSLGFVEISGKQDLNMNMEYYLRIPLKMVTQVGMSKLFGKKETSASEEDEIQYRDEQKRVRFVNLKLTGTPDNYSISLGKEKNP